MTGAVSKLSDLICSGVFFTIAQWTSIPCRIFISVYVDYCSLTVLHACYLLYVPLPFEILLCFDLKPAEERYQCQFANGPTIYIYIYIARE